MVTDSPRLLVARKGLPVNNLPELVAYMKANQDKMQYAPRVSDPARTCPARSTSRSA